MVDNEYNEYKYMSREEKMERKRDVNDVIRLISVYTKYRENVIKNSNGEEPAYETYEYDFCLYDNYPAIYIMKQINVFLSCQIDENKYLWANKIYITWIQKSLKFYKKNKSIIETFLQEFQKNKTIQNFYQYKIHNVNKLYKCLEECNTYQSF
jgi:hypothetical protein